MLVTSMLMLAAAEMPRPEPPRPDLFRPGWECLNGAWEFCFDPDDSGLRRGLTTPDADGFDRAIQVPYPWESRLSGIGDTEYRGAAWYRRTFQVPADWRGQRVHLCFGAVDWEARVWVNGREVGGHVGGYTPFRLDVTEALQPGDNTLVVRAWDVADPNLPTGKQVRWYTRTSGIWQTVWLESTASCHVTNLAVTTTLAPLAARVTATLATPTAGPVTVRLVADDATVAPVETTVDLPAGGGTVRLDVPVPGGRLWTPDSPTLYDYTLTARQGTSIDSVRSYFGLRTIEAGPLPGADYRGILLNGDPIYLTGALHQVFNPEGIYTFADDAAIRHDVQLSRDLGWNFLRLHIKVVDPRLLYWADRLGLLMMCDVPNTWEHGEATRPAWEATMREQLARDMAHPSIFAWVCFNESWGIGGGGLKTDQAIQAWVSAMATLTKQLDPSRLVEDNSPCLYDHVQPTDLNTWHFYIDQYEHARDHIAEVVRETYPGTSFNFSQGWTAEDEPLLNSEFGGVGAGSGDRDVAWCFKYLTTLLRARAKVQGYIYTEHCDIEWEHNGLVCYDRTPKVFGYDAFVPGMTPADLQRQDFVGYDAPPILDARPGDRIDLPLWVSHYSAEDGPPLIRWSLVGWDTLGRPIEGTRGTIEASWADAAVTPAGPLSVRLPDQPFVGAVGLELVAGGRRLAANYVNVLAGDGPLPAAEALAARRVALRFSPTAVSGFEAPEEAQVLARLDRDKLDAVGRPRFRYTLRLPEALRGLNPNRLTLLVEAGARGGEARLDWPARRHALDYPQTKDGRATPSTLAATLDGVPLGTAALADDWADARGVLSHRAYYQHGSHGERVELSLDLAGEQTLARRLATGEALELELFVPPGAADGMGLSIYGESMGRYLMPPTLLVDCGADLPVAVGWTSTEPITQDSVASRREVAVATGESGGAEWRYVTADPGDGWADAEFDDSAWRTGRGGFGRRGTPNAIIATRWESDDIWLRRTVELAAAPGESDLVTIRLYHDEDAEVLVNGQPLLRLQGYITEYRDVVLTAAQKRLFRAGTNQIAVHCHQTTGGQAIDVGLSLLRQAID